VYNETSGGCQKLLKNIDFPVDLEIAKEILSPNTR
jgi:ubiquitin carboxyl-terminal hydrolase 10